MPANLAQRKAFAESALFRDRVCAALYVQANTIGVETASEPSDRADKRIQLVVELFRNPEGVASWFARAAAGFTAGTDMADVYTDTAGTEQQKVDAITDSQIQTYVAGAWNVLAGVRPWERS